MNYKSSYQKLEELYEEATKELTETLKDNRSMEKELKYLWDFIAWKSLSSEYQDFRENAFLDPSGELPFPNYIM